MRIGRYIVGQQLGAGGMGVVYMAYDPALDREVALKLLNPDGIDLGGPKAAERLRREAQAMAKLSHPNVVGVFEVGEHDASVFIAMELVKGQHLADWWSLTARPWREVLRVFFQAGLGLAAAHEAGIVHRDFKPTNVIVGEDHRARVLDFGLASPTPIDEHHGAVLGDLDEHDITARMRTVAMARVGRSRTGSEREVSSHGFVVGTPAYMAPELHVGGLCDGRSDQFSFCVTLFEALYGARPFAGSTAFAIGEAMAEGDVRFPSKLARSRIPGWIEPILLRGLSYRPEQRYESMKALLAAFAFTSRILFG